MKTVRPPSLRHLVTGLAVLLGAALVAPVATAQTRPALVRDVDEPARVPYAHLVAPPAFSSTSAAIHFRQFPPANACA